MLISCQFWIRCTFLYTSQSCGQDSVRNLQLSLWIEERELMCDAKLVSHKEKLFCCYSPILASPTMMIHREMMYGVATWLKSKEATAYLMPSLDSCPVEWLLEEDADEDRLRSWTGDSKGGLGLQFPPDKRSSLMEASEDVGSSPLLAGTVGRVLRRRSSEEWGTFAWHNRWVDVRHTHTRRMMVVLPIGEDGKQGLPYMKYPALK